MHTCTMESPAHSVPATASSDPLIHDANADCTSLDCDGKSSCLRLSGWDRREIIDLVEKQDVPGE